MTLLGGDVALRGSNTAPLELISAGGHVYIGSVKGAGRVNISERGGLSFPDTLERGDITFENLVSCSTYYSNADWERYQYCWT